VVLDGGVPLVGPQEELCGPSVYTPRWFGSEPKTGGEVTVRIFGFYKNTQTKEKKRKKNYGPGSSDSSIFCPEGPM